VLSQTHTPILTLLQTGWQFHRLVIQELISRRDSERERFTTTSYM